jgi:hypothetical protein
MRYGVRNESESPRLLALLNEIEPYLVANAADKRRLELVVERVRQRAQNDNSSAVTGDIAALFSAPRLVGPEGIHDAVRGLVRILDSAHRGRRAISLAFAYQPLLTLSHNLEDIERDAGLSGEEFSTILKQVADALTGFWKAGAHNPLVFAPFAIPEPTAPSATIVHNWTFVSLEFARRANLFEPIDGSIAAAAQRPELCEAIAVARAVRSTAGDPIQVEPNDIAAEGKEQFYAAIGSRLAHLSRRSGDDIVPILEALLDQCLRLGPNGLDSSVMLLAISNDIRRSEDLISLKSYTHRLSRDRQLKLGLQPLLRALTFRGSVQQDL